MAKFCGKCGAGLVEGSKFCVKCGAPVPQAGAQRSAAPSETPGNVQGNAQGNYQQGTANTQNIYSGASAAKKTVCVADHRSACSGCSRIVAYTIWNIWNERLRKTD